MWLPTAGAAQTTAMATAVKSKEQINLKLCQANTLRPSHKMLISVANLAILWPNSGII